MAVLRQDTMVVPASPLARIEPLLLAKREPLTISVSPGPKLAGHRALKAAMGRSRAGKHVFFSSQSSGLDAAVSGLARAETPAGVAQFCQAKVAHFWRARKRTGVGRRPGAHRASLPAAHPWRGQPRRRPGPATIQSMYAPSNDPDAGSRPPPWRCPPWRVAIGPPVAGRPRTDPSAVRQSRTRGGTG